MRARSLLLLGISTTLPRDSPIFIGPGDFAALSITSSSLRSRGNAQLATTYRSTARSIATRLAAIVYSV